MKGMSIQALAGTDRERWAEARRRMYRGILRNPASSEAAKTAARRKLEATRKPPGAR